MEKKSMAASIRIEHRSVSRYRGQRDHDLRRGRVPGYVDQEKIGENSVILAAPEPSEMKRRTIAKRTGRERKLRSDAAVATVGILTTGAGLQEHLRGLSVEMQDEVFAELAIRVAEEFGTVVAGLVVHRDETSIHAHAVWECRSEDGVPMSKAMNGWRLQDIACEVFQKYIPETVRGVRKADRIERGDDASKIYHRSVRQLHADLPGEIAEAEEKLSDLRQTIIKLASRVVALERKQDRTEKETKRLETYVRRLGAKEEELQELRELPKPAEDQEANGPDPFM